MGIGHQVVWRICWPFARVVAFWFPLSVHHRERPPRGPFVAAINHYSHLDPPLAGLALRRPTRFMALDELWGINRFLDWAFQIFGAIPLPRENRYPVRALRVALLHLESGGVVGVFPEGRRVEHWGDTPLKGGAAWMAIRAGVPLVPVAIWGTQHAMDHNSLRIRRARVRVVFCKAIDPSTFAVSSDPVSEMTEAWRQAIDHEITAFGEQEE